MPQALAVRRPPDRPGLAADARASVVPDRRDARGLCRGRGDGADGARRGARGDEARARHQAARLLPQPVALLEMLHRRHAVGGGERRRRLRRGRDACGCSRTASRSRRRRATTTATSNSTSSTRTRAPTSVEIDRPGRQEEDGRGHARRQRQPRRDQAVAIAAVTLRCASRACGELRCVGHASVAPYATRSKPWRLASQAAAALRMTAGGRRPMIDPSTPSSSPRSARSTQACAPWAEALLRVVVGLCAGAARAAQHLRILPDHRRALAQPHRAGGAARPRRLSARQALGAGDLAHAVRRRAAAGASACSRARRRCRS